MSSPPRPDIFNGYAGEAGASPGGLLDLDLLADLFGFHLLDLGDGDGQDTVLHLGGDVFAVRVLGDSTLAAMSSRFASSGRSIVCWNLV